MTDAFVLGDYNAICHECGRKRKASQLKKHWQGYYVCVDCYEPRHPQDFVRSPPPEKAPTWIQPPAADNFVAPFEEPDPFVPPGFDDPTS